MDELGRKNSLQFKNAQKWPMRIILDNLRSHHNIGSIFRTADAFLVESIYLCGICAVPPHREIHKTALGATESVNWEYFPTTLAAINKSRIDGYKIIIIEQTDQSTDLSIFKPGKEPIALVFGNEVNGISEEILPFVDEAIEIPQFGTKHSFNVSVTAGIVLFYLHANK